MAPTVTALLRSRPTLVWAGLVVATLVSWQVGSDRGLHARLASTIVILVAFIKVRFVGLHFMELRTAPPALRVIFEAYSLVVCATLIVMYLVIGA